MSAFEEWNLIKNQSLFVDSICNLAKYYYTKGRCVYLPIVLEDVKNKKITKGCSLPEVVGVDIAKWTMFLERIEIMKYNKRGRNYALSLDKVSDKYEVEKLICNDKVGERMWNKQIELVKIRIKDFHSTCRFQFILRLGDLSVTRRTQTVDMFIQGSADIECSATLRQLTRQTLLISNYISP